MLRNFVRESVSGTPGTGTITLNGATTGHIGFQDAGYASNDKVNLVIVDGSSWEAIIGTLTIGATDTVAITKVLATWNGTTFDDTAPTALSLTSAAEVAVTDSAYGLQAAHGFSTPGTYGIASALAIKPTVSQSTLSTDTVYAVPFVLMSPMYVQQIGVELSAAAGTKIRAGIYQVDENNKPNRLIATTGDQTPSAAALNINLSAAVMLTPGTYFVAIIQDGANTWEMMNRSYVPNAFPQLAAVDNPSYMFSVSAASWSALPDPFGTPSNEYLVNVPFIRLL